MDTHGYTRRDHRQRKRRSRRGNELLLDRLLKIFFYILVVLIAIIVIKVVFFSGKEENKTQNTDNKVNTNSAQMTDKDNASGSDTSTSGTGTEDNTEDTTGEEETTGENETEEPTDENGDYIPQGDYTLFNNSAFVGDSRIGGLYLSSQLTTSTFYYNVGGNVSSAVEGAGITLDDGTEGSVIDALKQKQFDNIFLQYGVNEWGWSTDGFIQKYEDLINEIKAVQPDAKIYVMSIIPVTDEYAEERSEEAMNVNQKLDEMDAQVKAMTERLGVTYINVVEGVTGGERVLTNDMSSDGYHLNRAENLKLLDYICEKIK